MLAPLRSAFAGQLMVCDMKSSSEISPVNVEMTTEHCMHQMAVSDERGGIDHQSTNMLKSCCNDSGAYKSDCHSAITASLFMQRTQFSPVLINTDVLENTTHTLIVRALSPPSRPPLLLHS